MNMLGKTAPHFTTRLDLDPERQHVHERRSRHHLRPARRRHRTATREPASRSRSAPTYHQDLVDPAHLDPPAAGRSGRMTLTGEVTMVIN